MLKAADSDKIIKRAEMVEINLSQADADQLIAMRKLSANDDECEYPGMGGSLCLPLVSEDKRENFFLDINRGKIELKKGKNQNRAKQVVVLVRLDFGGTPHRNPDGSEIGCPHLHLYREGFADKWAFPAPADKFSDLSNLWKTLE